MKSVRTSSGVGRRLSPSPFLLFFGLSLALLLAASGAALAHATLVLVTLTTDPAQPAAGEPFTLRIEMTDPTEFPIEDAVVVAEFSGPGGELVSASFAETATPGVYETELALPANGTYTLLLRDQTFRQEEAQVSQEVTLGSGPLFPEGENGLVFPPTAVTSERSLRTWLVWLIALPILAGIVVTVLVLRGTPRPEA